MQGKDGDGAGKERKGKDRNRTERNGTWEGKVKGRDTAKSYIKKHNTVVRV